MRRTSPDGLYDAYIFDMDGTIHLDDDLLSGAKRSIEGLCGLGRPARSLSNNPTKDPQLYLEELGELGIPTSIEEIASTVVATVRWFKANRPNTVVFSISEKPLKRALAEVGIAMSKDSEKIDIATASYDRTFEYRKLQIAFDAIWFHRKAFPIMTGPDRYYPFPGGCSEPDVATIVVVIKACTGAKCQVNVGGPEATMLPMTIDDLDVDPANRMMVGDRLMIDIGMAIKMNVASCLFSTGDSTLEEIEALDSVDRSAFVLDHADHLIPKAVRPEWGWFDVDE